jgi:hypothetical protein
MKKPNILEYTIPELLVLSRILKKYTRKNWFKDVYPIQPGDTLFINQGLNNEILISVIDEKRYEQRTKEN